MFSTEKKEVICAPNEVCITGEGQLINRKDHRNTFYKNWPTNPAILWSFKFHMVQLLVLEIQISLKIGIRQTLNSREVNINIILCLKSERNYLFRW